MNGGRATWAIAGMTLQRPGGYVQSAAFFLFGYAAVSISSVSQVFLLCAALAAAFFALRPERIADLTCLRYFAAPLYGREVARAHAIAASARVLVAGAAIGLALVFSAAQAQTHGWQKLAVYLLAQLVVVLVASLGCLRKGRDRRLYAVFGIDAGLVVDALGFPASPLAVAAAVLAAAVIGFAALRALGETLARYDPVE